MADRNWQLIAESIPSMAWTTSADGGDQRWNQRAYDYTGWPADTPLDDMWLEVVHPDDVARVVRTWQDAMRTGSEYSTECRYRRADGEFRWHCARGLPVRDSAGEVVRWIGTATDIHEYKTSETALRESGDRLTEAQRLARFGSWSVDMATGAPTWSDEMYRLLGYEVDEFTPDLDWFDRVHPADVGRVRAVALAHASRPEATEDEFRIVLPGGAVRWLASRTVRVFHPAGHLIGIHGTVQDVTERRRAEDQLRFQAELLDAVGEAVIATDLTGCIVYWSPGAEELYGWSAQEAIGRRIVDLIPTVHGSYDGADIMGPREKGEEWSGTMELRRRDTSTFVAQITRTPVLDDAGRLVALIGTSTDVSAREAARAELEQAHRTAAETLTVLDTLQAEAPMGFAFVDRDLRFVRMNREMGVTLGFSTDEVVGRSVADVLPAALWEQVEPVYRDVLAGGSTVRERRVIAPQGTLTQEIITSHYPVRVGDQIIGVGVVIHDVTDRVRAEGFRSAVMSQVADGVYTQDYEGRLMYMNSAASTMLGWTETELRGKHMHEVVHFQDAEGNPVEAAECVLLAGAEGVRRLEGGVGEIFTRKDGSIFPVTYSAVPLRSGSSVEGIAVIFRDVSEPSSLRTLIRVLIVDPDRPTTESFKALLDRHDGIEVVGVATTSAAAVDAAGRLKPDVALVNAELPDVGGLGTTVRIKALGSTTRVILMSEKHDDAMAIAGIEAGCAGVLDKSRAWVDLVSAVRAAYHGETIIPQEELQRVLAQVRGGGAGRGTHLTGREEEVLSCMRDGLTNAQVAERLGVTANTVRNHVQRILYKLNVHSKLEAVVLTSREGLHHRES